MAETSSNKVAQLLDSMVTYLRADDAHERQAYFELVGQLRDLREDVRKESE